jgi:hypothetical protein
MQASGALVVHQRPHQVSSDEINNPLVLQRLAEGSRANNAEDRRKSVVEVDRISLLLEEAKRAGLRERLRVSIPCLTVACVSQLLFVAWLLNMYFSGKYIYFIQSFGMLAVPICMLALLPTDVYWTSIFLRLCSAYYILASLLCVGMAVSPYQHLTQRHLPTGVSDAGDNSTKDGYCMMGPLPWLYCEEVAAYYTLIAIGYLCGGIALAQVWFKYAERDMIIQTWRTEAYVEIYFSVVMFIMVPLFILARRKDWHIFATIANEKGLNIWLLTTDWVLHMLSHVIGGLLATTDFRLGFQSWLSSRSEALAAAAGISALLGTRTVKEIRVLAQEAFRKFDLSDLRREDLDRTTADFSKELNSTTLSDKTQPALLGTVDMFISHSWHDSTSAKWDALQSVREHFRQAHHNSEPSVWFDKACLNQSKLDEDLACLPVFLGGCSKLVVIAGPTYTSRMWCVVELFVFLHMGGKASNIELVLLGSGADAEKEVTESFASFDARSASCFKKEDEGRLLTMIEAGFGGLDKFNAKVRCIFAEVQANARKRATSSGLSQRPTGNISQFSLS